MTADIGWRHQGYAMRGDRFDGIRFDQRYDFALPRLGVTFAPRHDLSLFASWAQSRREPAFRDLYDAEGAGSVPLYSNGKPLIRPERVNDYEAGASWRGAGAQASANLFRMDFRDELVYAGQFNTDLGYPILGNAARSVHQGVELAGRVERGLAHDLKVTLDGNTTLSDNHFVEYREVYGLTPADIVSYDGKAIGFFPAVLANLSARVGWKDASAGLEMQHAGRMYLDNTESILASAGPRTIFNATAAWRFALGAQSRAELSLRVFNLLDTRYAAGGYMDYDALGNLVPQFVPAATRNVLGQVRVGF